MTAADGFLGNSSTAIERIRYEFANWFAVVRDLNRLGMSLFPLLKPRQDDHQMILAGTLYGRCLLSVQGAVLLAERGLAADTRTIVRAATETAITLGALVRDEGVIDLLLLRYAYADRAMRNACLRDPEAAAMMSPEQVATVRGVIANLERDFPRLAEQRGDPFKIEQLARVGGALSLYNAIYRPTSTDAAHATFASLNRHIDATAEGGIRGLRFGPNVTDLAETLSNMATVLAFVSDVMLTAHALEAQRPALEEFVAQWKALGVPADYVPPARRATKSSE